MMPHGTPWLDDMFICMNIYIYIYIYLDIYTFASRYPSRFPPLQKKNKARVANKRADEAESQLAGRAFGEPNEGNW